MEARKIGIANDHAGYELKLAFKKRLVELGFDVVDFGCDSTESCDYADYAHPLGLAIDNGTLGRGITICGSGNGIAMAVNKHPKVRAALCWEVEPARLARAHNNANVCSIPARFVSTDQALAILEMFLNTPFEGGRHCARIAKIPL